MKTKSYQHTPYATALHGLWVAILIGSLTFFIENPAAAKTMQPPSDLTLDISGQLNFMGLNVDDGSDHYNFIATNSISNSRLNVNTVLQPKNSSLKAGSNLQFSFPLNPSDTLSQAVQTFTGQVDMRKVEIYLSDKHFGSLFLGEGSTASDDMSEIDYSNTDIVGYSAVADIGGGVFVRDQAGSIVATPTISQLYNNLDGFGRAVRIQYHSPSFHGLSLSTSYANPSRHDLVLLYKNRLHGIKMGGAVALTTTQNYFSGPSFVRGNGLNGSASVLLPTGVSLTFAGGYLNSKTEDRDSPAFWYGKLGYQSQLMRAGLTAVSIDYGHFKSFYENDNRAKAYGVQILQTINLLNLSVYAGYRHYRPGEAFRNLNLVSAGMIYKFQSTSL